MATEPLAMPDDVADLWHPLSTDETVRVTRLIDKASAKLRQACPFDIDERIALFTTAPTAPTALDPSIVADVVAQIVHRFLVNQDGVASGSSSEGPFSRSATFVNRYDKTGSDVRGAIQVTESDIDQLRPAVPAPVPSSFRVKVPCPQVLIPGVRRVNGFGPGVAAPIVIPDYAPGSGAE